MTFLTFIVTKNKFGEREFPREALEDGMEFI